MANTCKECGYPLQGNETACPECGCPVEQSVQQQSQQEESISQEQHQVQEQCYSSEPNSQKTDWAQYVYECSVIAWKTFKKYACFKGRASRREYWSFWIIAVVPFFVKNMYETVETNSYIHSFSNYESVHEYSQIDYNYTLLGYLFIFILALPWIGVTIRRLHDIGKCGWWLFVPFANFFLLLKRSDEGANKYGEPNPAKNLL